MSIQYAKRLFNIDEYHRMIETGILKTDDRVELIDGEILSMPPIGSRHASRIDKLNQLFNFSYGSAVIVRIQSPIQLNDLSEPQPDIAVLRFTADFYSQQHPKPADVRLLIEIADSTIEYDRNIKLPNYAKSSIIECWLFDLNKSRIEIYREPLNGIYQNIRIAQPGQQISALNFPDISLSVDEILG